jgi:site-specific DNA recombinase
MKAAIYVRFSSELQNDRSIDDQVALCRQYAERNNLSVTTVYDDRARSGASVLGRYGLLRLMDAAREKAFDVIIVEALDRLSRDQEDLAGIWKRLQFLGIEIRAVHEGKADAIQVGVRGLVGALYLQDLAHKVRRGMTGVIRDGRHAGGRAYGYRPIAGKPGEMHIVPEEAEVIRRIFAAYVAGDTPREIAGALNKDGIPPPRGTRWNASTINGSRQRGYGILHNAMYGGRLVWNRVRMVKDPDSGKRVSRANSADQWQSVPAPQLAIVHADIFAAVQARKQALGGERPQSRRRPRRLLSGLLKCGCCGSGMAANGTDKSKKIRVQCSAVRESGTCTHKRRYYLESIEEVVVTGLRDELRDPQLIAEYVKTYHEERRRLLGSVATERNRREQKLAETKRAIDRLVDALAEGLMTATAIRDKLLALEAKKTQLEAQLAEPQPATDVISLHPSATAKYLQQIEQLSQSLKAGLCKATGSSATWFRALVEKVIVHPVPPRAALDIEVQGYMAQLIAEPRLPPNGRFVGGERPET